MSEVMIDGKLYDAESGSFVRNANANKNHDVTVQSTSNGYEVIVERDDGSTWSWFVDSSQLVDLIDNINGLTDGVSELGTSLDTLSGITSESLVQLQEVVDAPADYYQYISDMFGQVVFFVSMIFGVLVFIVFSTPFRK